MTLQTCFCLTLLRVLFTSAEIMFSADKARELNTYIIINYENRYQTELPGLKTKFDEAALACETQINKTINSCLACIERNPSSGQSPDTFAFDKVILGVFPDVTDLENFGKGVKDALEKDSIIFTETVPGTVDKLEKQIDKFVTDTVPKTAKKIDKGIDKFITDTVPKAAKNIDKGIDKFVTDTIPKAAKSTDKEFDTFVTGTLPFTTKTIGKHLDKFFSGTIPSIGKSIGKGFKRFGNTIKGLFGLRKRRATSMCPPCDLINIDKKSADEIWRGVCGDIVFNIFKNKYTNMVRIFRWLKDGNIIVNQVSFRTEDTTIKPLENVFTVTPFNVTYSIGDGDKPRVYTDTSTTLDLYDDTNSLLGHVLADKIWDEYVF